MSVEVQDFTFQVRKGYESAIAKALRKTVIDIEANAKNNVTNQDSIDTGALRASIFSETPDKPGYAAAEAEAVMASRTPGRHSGRPNPNFVMLDAPEPPRALEAIAGVGAEYAVYVEFGTAFVPPAPFYGPAEEMATEAFEDQCVEMINREVK